MKDSKTKRKPAPKRPKNDKKPPKLKAKIAFKGFSVLKQEFDSRFHADLKEDEFANFMQMINLRASMISSQHAEFPQMDMSALFCLATTIEEYSRYLNNGDDAGPSTDSEVVYDAEQAIKAFKKERKIKDTTKDVYIHDDDNNN